MERRLKFLFHEAAEDNSSLPTPENGLTCIVRTDARHATKSLKHHMHEALKSTADNTMTPDEIEKIVHDAYLHWGHEVLEAMLESVDLEKMGLPEDKKQKDIYVHFYNAFELSKAVTAKARKMVALNPDFEDLPIVFLNLDDMIENSNEDHWSAVGFSRLFSLNSEQHDYVGRPGMGSIEQQLDDVVDRVKKLHTAFGTKVPVVLLEDNVRHARMINWFIGKLEDHGVLDYAEIAGVSTCFCCACDDELSKLKYNGKTIPVTAVVDYVGTKVDVVTTRDLLFDGFVVEIEDRNTRLPGLFMDLEKHFKLHPEKTPDFKKRVTLANIHFCEELEKKTGMPLPLEWFKCADAIAHITGTEPSTHMKDILKNLIEEPQPKHEKNKPSRP